MRNRNKSPIYLVRRREGREHRSRSRSRSRGGNKTKCYSRFNRLYYRYRHSSSRSLSPKDRRNSSSGSPSSPFNLGNHKRCYSRNRSSEKGSRYSRSRISRSRSSSCELRKSRKRHRSVSRSKSKEIHSKWSEGRQKAESSNKTAKIVTGLQALKPQPTSGNTLSVPDNNLSIEQTNDSTEEETMLKVMGFSGFDSTKGKPVEGNDIEGLPQLATVRKYRQYMNRRGGFNRLLDFTD